MTQQLSLTWPSAIDCSRLNKKIFETDINPFGIASYNPNEPVYDFVGRVDELNYLKEQINLVFKNKISRAIRLEGPAGVGKSTLFNYLKESIQKERQDETPKSFFILRDSDIFSTYFQIPDKIMEFSDIWKPMLEGLRAGFEIETGIDITLPEYIAFHIIFKLFKIDNEGISKIIWKNKHPPEKMHQIEIRDIIEPLFNRGNSAVKDLQAYFTEKKKDLRNVFKTEINNAKYEIFKADNKKIMDLFRVIDEDDPENYLELILGANNKLFKGNDELISYFNDLMRYYACCTGKQPLLLIGIDEIAKVDAQFQDKYYQNLGNLFVRLRNSLNYILFVFISTIDDWGSFDKALKDKTDLLGQIDEFMHSLVLNQLKIEELIQVFKKRMDRFWANYSSYQSVIAPHYPFSDYLFEYVYRYNKRDLRKSIHFLREMWIKFRYDRTIPKFETKFECMQNVRKYLGIEFISDQLRKFEWKIIRDSFTDPSRFTSNSARSSAVEKGIENAWKCLYFEDPPTVTKVKNNNTISTSTGNYRPDIYIEIYGNLGAEYRRNVEFQVKAYGPKNSVSLEHIQSSLELFEKNYTDFIYFIITGKGLDANAEAKVKELEKNYPTRIRRPTLTEKQEDNLYLLTLYEEVSGTSIGQNQDNGIKISKKILSNIIGQDLSNFILEIKKLAYRESIIDVQTLEVPEQEIDITPTINVISGDTKQLTLISKSKTLPEIPTKPVDWLKEFSEFEQYKNELCALCEYLKTRETGTHKFKFTIATVEKNVITSNAALSKKSFKALIVSLKSKKLLISEKTSLKLTPQGENLYLKVKASNYAY